MLSVIPENEKQLLDALKQDDPSAFRSIFATYHSLLCRLSYKIVTDEDAAKDLVQDVFIKLWQNRKKLNIQHSLAFYLKRAVVNASINYLDRTRKFVAITPAQTDAAHSPHHAEQSQSYQELSTQIDKAITNLPPRTRAVFTLIRFDEMSYKEVADSLNISIKAVEKEMMKALSILRQSLKDYLVILFIILFR